MTGSEEHSGGGEEGALALDVEYWSVRDDWSPEEFEWLVLGIDPDRVREDHFDQQPYQKRRDKIRRRFDRSTRQKNRYPTPREALQIAEDIGEAFPPDLVAAVQSAPDHGLMATPKKEPADVNCPRAQDLTAQTRRIQTLQKLIVVITAKLYGWNLANPPTTAMANELQQDFEELGLTIDPATIRDHLADITRSLKEIDAQMVQSYFKKD